MVPQGRGAWHITNQDHADFDEEEDDDYTDGDRQDGSEPDLPPDAGLKPGKLDDLQADNTPYLHEAEPTHEFPEDATDIQTMSHVDTPVQLPEVIASQYPDAAQVQANDVEEDEDKIGDMPANVEKEINDIGSEKNADNIPQNDTEDVQINTNQAVSPWTQSITRIGRAVKYRSDMFNNFSLLQQTDEMNEGREIRSYAFTQYSLRQGLKKFTDKTRAAAMADVVSPGTRILFPGSNQSIETINRIIPKSLHSRKFVPIR
jgi:hypothetical protein